MLNSFFPFSSFSWIMWRRRPRTERHHRVTWLPPRLSQLRQLYLADNNRGEEPDPAHLRHAGAGGRLWYCISLWWSAIAWQLKNEVRSWSSFALCTFLVFSSSPHSWPNMFDTWTAAFLLKSFISPEWKWQQVKKTWASALIWLDYCQTGWTV